MNKYWTDISPVSPWVAYLFGIMLWLPGLGIPLNDILYLQPIEILNIGWLCITLVPSRASSLRAYSDRELLLLSAGLIISWAISTVWSLEQSTSILFLSYYLLCVLPGILLFYVIAKDGSLFVRFVSGFIFGAIVSSIAGFLQTALGSHMVRLVNNRNFSLIYGLRKASGFTPEASVLAGLLIIAIIILLLLFTDEGVRTYCGRHGIASYLTNKRSIGLTLLVLLSALFSTLSSSVIIVLPLVTVTCYIMLHKQQKRRSILLLLLYIIMLVGIFIYFAWSTRSLEDSIGSIVLRFSSMLAAIEIAADNWLHGVGLGMLKTVIGEYIRQNIHAWDAGRNIIYWIGQYRKDGVDSFPLHMIAEQGILMLVLFIIALKWIFSMRNQRETYSKDPELLSMVSALSISIFIIGSLTVGYRGLLHAWLLFPGASAIKYMLNSKPR